MAKKQKKANKIILKKSLYDINAVKEALKDFKKVCEGKTVSKKNSIEVTLKSNKINFKNNLADEFCNYVIGLMKNKSLV